MSKIKKAKNTLLQSYQETTDKIEIGIDEVGRGPMFGRVYIAAVILPQNSSNFDYTCLKDSKKFTSEKKIKEVSEYIKQNCLKYSINWQDEKCIDNDNIRIATFKAMHCGLKELINKFNNYLILVDGKDFIPYSIIDENSMLKNIDYKCIEGGDNKYCSIAAASILAKVARDEYIKDLCNNNPKLMEYYKIDKNKGYGTKEHLDGINKFGLSCWHRKTFGTNKNQFENNEFPEIQFKEMEAKDILEKEELKELPIT